MSIACTHLSSLGEMELAAIYVAAGTSLILAHRGELLAERRLGESRLIIWDGCAGHRVKIALCVTDALERVDRRPLIGNLTTDAGVPCGAGAIGLVR